MRTVQEAHITQQNTLGGGEGSSACLLGFLAVRIGPGTVTLGETLPVKQSAHIFISVIWARSTGGLAAATSQ